MKYPNFRKKKLFKFESKSLKKATKLLAVFTNIPRFDLMLLYPYHRIPVTSSPSPQMLNPEQSHLC